MNELTRAELFEMICPTDATYDCNQGNCSSSCDKCEDILNYLLDRYDAKVRADAIAEFKDLGKLYSEIREEAYKEFAEVIAMDIADCKTCPIGCKDNSYGECEKRLVQYVKTMRGEKE